MDGGLRGREKDRAAARLVRRAPLRAGAGAVPAIATICIGVFFLAANDAVAKWLTAHYPPLQILFLRNLIALPAVLAICLWSEGREVVRTRHLRLHVLRGGLLVGGGLTFFLGLSFLPLAEATSLVFAAPIFITALSVPLLGEHVGWRRWTACLVGFLGVLVIVRPGGEAFQAASLLPVATAVFYALIMLSARRIGEDESVWTLMLYVTAVPLVFTALAVPFVWVAPDLSHLPHFAAIAILGTLGMTLISQSFRMAAASVVAPFDYTSLIWASIFGWLIWSEVPGTPTYIGASIIVSSGLYILLRERRRG